MDLDPLSADQIKALTPDQAKDQIGRILTWAKSVGDKAAQNDAAIADLRAAVKAQVAVAPHEIGNDDADVRKYVTSESHKNVVKGVRLAAQPEDSMNPNRVRPWGLCDDPAPVGAWQKRLQSLVEQRTWVRLGLRSTGGALGASPYTDAQIEQHLRNAPAEIKRSFADASTVGAELIPDLLMPDLERDIVLDQERRIVSLFKQVQMPGKNLLLPIATGGLRPYKKGDAINDNNPGQYTASSPTLAQRTVSAIAMVVRCVVDEDASEDAVIAMIPQLQMMAVEALNDGQEDAIINSDTNATHQDTGITTWDIRERWGSAGLGGSSDHRRTVLGLRGEAIDVGSSGGVNDGGSAQTLAGFNAARSLMGPHGFTKPGDLVCITSPEYLLKISNFAEFVSVDKAGALAYNVNGLVGQCAGVPIVTSLYVDRKYNASGIYDETTKTKTGFLLVNRARYTVYTRKGAMVESDRDISRGITQIVSTMRWNFKTRDANAALKTNVLWTYNLTP